LHSYDISLRITWEKAFQEHQQAQDERKKSQKRITEAVDQQRDEIIEILNEIWGAFHIKPLTKPTESKDYASDFTA
jgi:seryl-tRNA synthetase